MKSASYPCTWKASRAHFRPSRQPNGLILFTFTPLWGMTEIVRQFQEAPADSMKFTVTATWDDAPHLDEKTRADLFASIPAYQRENRTKGIPQLGSSTIYHISDEEILVKPFEIPDYWPGIWARRWLNGTAAIWGARTMNRALSICTASITWATRNRTSTRTLSKLRRLDSWVTDPAAKGRSQVDGTQLIQRYRREGLNCSPG